MGNCCTTKIKSKVNSDNTNNGIYARNTNGSQFQQNFPRTNSGYSRKKCCPYCFEPIGEDFHIQYLTTREKCAKCNKYIGGYFKSENCFKCEKCEAYFHLWHPYIKYF